MSQQHSIYIFVGPPGAGKGSLSRWCTKNLGFRQISTGDLCRQHIARNTPIGQEIDFAIKCGKLVSDALVTCMVEEWLGGDAGSCPALIFDGYPRTVAQARDLDQLLKRQGQGIEPQVVRFSLPDGVILTRLGGRYVCRGGECQAVYSFVEGAKLSPKDGNTCDACGESVVRRHDDAPEAVLERVQTYRRHEVALLDACKQLGWKIIDLQVDRPLDEVVREFCKLTGAECP